MSETAKWFDVIKSMGQREPEPADEWQCQRMPDKCARPPQAHQLLAPYCEYAFKDYCR